MSNSSFGDLNTPESIAALNEHLADHSFLGDANATAPTQLDIEMFQKLSLNSMTLLRNNPNIFRWTKALYSHLPANGNCCGDMANNAITKAKDVHNRPEKGKKKAVEQKPKLPHPGKPIDPPAYLAKRVAKWDILREKHNQYIAAKQENESKAITITLPNGSTKEGESWKTTPMIIAKGISNSLAKQCIIAKVNGVLWDMTRPFEEDVKLELLKFDNDEAKEVFWHSSAHVIGEAMEQYLGGSLVFGPPLEDGGFYYDIDSEFTIGEKDFPNVEKVVQGIVKENQPFERLIVSKEDLLEMFDYNVSGRAIGRLPILTPKKIWKKSFLISNFSANQLTIIFSPFSHSSKKFSVKK